MATFKYFGQDNEELFSTRPTENKWIEKHFPGVKAARVDHYNSWIGYRSTEAKVNDQWFPVVRVIEFKKTAEPHKCDSRCTSAKGNKCECSCGGKYHGSNR